MMDVDGSPSFAAAPGGSLSSATGLFVVAAWLHAGGLECSAGDPTSKWKSLSSTSFFFFLEGITLHLLEIGLFSVGVLLDLVFCDLLLLEPVVLVLAFTSWV